MPTDDVPIAWQGQDLRFCLGDLMPDKVTGTGEIKGALPLSNVADADNEGDEDTESTDESVDHTSNLPDETLLLIFRHALPPSWVMWCGSSLAPFPQTIWSADIETKLCIMGVCKTWHRLGLEFLYENVTLRSLGQLAAFVRTLEARPELSVRTRRLGICYPVVRGYTTLHFTESNKIFELCPRLTHFVFNSQPILGGHRAPENPPAFPAIAGVCLALTNLDIGDEVEYPVVLPALVQLCHTLQSLSLLLPDQYGDGHPKLTFTRLENLRVAFTQGSHVPAAYWVCPGLQQLAIRAQGSMTTEIYQALASVFLAAYGAKVTALTVRPLDIMWRGSLPFPLPDLSAQCPMLRYLGVTEHAVNGEPPLCHPTVVSLDIFRNGRPDVPPDGEFERLQSRFPALRACRYVQMSLAFTPLARGGPDGISSIDQGTPDEYDLPLGPWLTVLWSEESPDGSSDDLDYVYISEEEWFSEDGSQEHPDQYWEYYSDGERKHSPWSGATSEDEFDYEVARDEALTIFEHTLHRAFPEEEDSDDEVEEDSSD
ncbi:hypothetical protein B0H12DRAFT_444525 [Mycena haematopus]|nr:hypothetical protein B0H12DRAFT_444525 [Mycena haematopus]